MKDYSKDHFLSNNGWSSHKFREHFVHFIEFHPEITIHIGRTVIVVNDKLKIHCHPPGYGIDVISISDMNGKILDLLTCDVTPDRLTQIILNRLTCD